MPSVKLTSALREEYQRLFDACQVRPDKVAEVDAAAGSVAGNRSRYEAVGEPLGIPWHFVGVIHNMEGSLNFRTHLHNGDPLTARTVHVPAGRPREGSPPFSWEQSAADALRLRALDKCADWTLPALLYQLEGYNGWGYRLHHPHVLSPYLWSGSQHYTSGKYVADGTWSDTAVSKQTGAAVLLRRLAEKGLVAFEGEPVAEAEELPALRYAPGEDRPEARQLQAFLNRFPGVYLREDGQAGDKTSDAFRSLTGYHLKGDPRAQGGRPVRKTPGAKGSRTKG